MRQVTSVLTRNLLAAVLFRLMRRKMRANRQLRLRTDETFIFARI